ncbi:MAG: HNH endonuclease [Bacteroidia bacterium]|nr:HNH endonuclease [Bacteroidia bacterium]
MRVIRGGQYGKRAIPYNRPASPTVESQAYSLLTWKLLSDWFFPEEAPKTSPEFTHDPIENQRRINYAKSHVYSIQNGLKDFNRIQEAFENVGKGNASAEDFNIVNKEVKIRNSHLAESNHPKTAAGYESTPEGYTWHHHHDYGRMQLVEDEVHSKTGHTGGFSLWRKK